MKKRYLIKLGVILLLAVLMGSCKKWINPVINDDPDSSLDAPYAQLLPGIEANIGYVLGGMDVRGITGMWVQYVSGQARQAATIGKNYNITEADVDNLWQSTYEGILMNLSIMISKTGDANPQARGVAKVLMAFSIGQTTDLFGDVPYAEAFLGNLTNPNFKPKYDSQQSIYRAINTLLTEAISDLSTPSSANLTPFGAASNDLIYSGTVANWIAAAHSLRARYALHLSNKGTVDYNAVLADCAAGIKSNANNFQVPFGITESNANPLYEFDQQRGDVATSPSFETFAAGDPRLAVFQDGSFGSFYGSINSPAPIITYVETKFIEAEAQFRLANQAAANSAYDNAVKASIANFGIPKTADTGAVNSTKRWISNNTTYSTTTELGPGRLSNRTIKNIIEAKYIALFMQTEGYNDFRRTGFPVLVLTGSKNIPARYPYATSERLYNSTNVPNGITFDTPVWWMGSGK